LTQSFVIGFSQLFAWVLHEKANASCSGEKFVVLGERAWIAKASVWTHDLYHPVGAISLGALQVGHNSRVTLGWCDKTSTFCHSSCI